MKKEIKKKIKQLLITTFKDYQGEFLLELTEQIKELVNQEKQKLMEEIEIAFDKKHEKEPNEDIRQGISYCINVLIGFKH